jgi:hypothetical protein
VFPKINELPRSANHISLFRDMVINSENVVLSWAIGELGYHFCGPLMDALKFLSIQSTNFAKKMTIFMGKTRFVSSQLLDYIYPRYWQAEWCSCIRPKAVHCRNWLQLHPYAPRPSAAPEVPFDSPVGPCVEGFEAAESDRSVLLTNSLSALY